MKRTLRLSITYTSSTPKGTDPGVTAELVVENVGSHPRTVSGPMELPAPVEARLASFIDEHLHSQWGDEFTSARSDYVQALQTETADAVAELAARHALEHRWND